VFPFLRLVGGLCAIAANAAEVSDAWTLEAISAQRPSDCGVMNTHPKKHKPLDWTYGAY
jgi:hypothetical protein